MARLTQSQIDAYTAQTGYILYLRDRAQLNYHFGKLGQEGWAALAHPGTEPPDPNVSAARAAFLAEYGLPEYAPKYLTERTKRDLKGALHARRVPGWALNLLTANELREIEGVKGF